MNASGHEETEAYSCAITTSKSLAVGFPLLPFYCFSSLFFCLFLLSILSCVFASEVWLLEFVIMSGGFVG